MKGHYRVVLTLLSCTSSKSTDINDGKTPKPSTHIIYHHFINATDNYASDGKYSTSLLECSELGKIEWIAAKLKIIHCHDIKDTELSLLIIGLDA